MNLMGDRAPPSGKCTRGDTPQGVLLPHSSVGITHIHFWGRFFFGTQLRVYPQYYDIVMYKLTPCTILQIPPTQQEIAYFFGLIQPRNNLMLSVFAYFSHHQIFSSSITLFTPRVLMPRSPSSSELDTNIDLKLVHMRGWEFYPFPRKF